MYPNKFYGVRLKSRVLVKELGVGERVGCWVKECDVGERVGC